MNNLHLYVLNNSYNKVVYVKRKEIHFPVL